MVLKINMVKRWTIMGLKWMVIVRKEVVMNNLTSTNIEGIIKDNK